MSPTAKAAAVAVWRQLPFFLWLIALWMLLWGQFTVLAAVTGLVVALFVTRVFRLPPVELSGRVNLWYGAAFVVMFFFAVLRAGVALVVAFLAVDFFAAVVPVAFLAVDFLAAVNFVAAPVDLAADFFAAQHEQHIADFPARTGAGEFDAFRIEDARRGFVEETVEDVLCVQSSQFFGSQGLNQRADVFP
mgnify:CR=1 FL=1